MKQVLNILKEISDATGGEVSITLSQDTVRVDWWKDDLHCFYKLSVTEIESSRSDNNIVEFLIYYFKKEYDSIRSK